MVIGVRQTTLVGDEITKNAMDFFPVWGTKDRIVSSFLRYEHMGGRHGLQIISEACRVTLLKADVPLPFAIVLGAM